MGLECVVNVSEGRDRALLDRLSDEVGDTMLDRHSDPDHHRTVFTLAGTDDAVEASVRRLTVLAVEILDLGTHQGRHPRLGWWTSSRSCPWCPWRSPPRRTAVPATRGSGWTRRPH